MEDTRMNIDIIRCKHNNLYVVEFYDDYESIHFRLSGEYLRKKDADLMARQLNIMFDKIRKHGIRKT
jgi:hypothetical protein